MSALVDGQPGAATVRAGRHGGSLQFRVIGRASSLAGPSWLGLLLEDGDALVVDRQHEVPVRAPALVWQPWGEGRSVRLAPGVIAAHVFVGPNALANAIGTQPEARDLRDMAERAITTPLSPDTPAFDTLSTCFAAIHREVMEGGAAATTLIEAHLRILLIEVWRAQHVQPGASRRNTPAQRSFDRFIGLVEGHFRERWTVARYADALGLSRDRLGDICQRVHGRGPKEIVDARVAREARLLLQNSTLSIEEAAGLLGFQSAAQFNRFVRRLTGLPPGRLRLDLATADPGAQRESIPLHDWP